MKSFKNILYLVEPELEQTAALTRAVSLAETNQAQLTLLQVSKPPRTGFLTDSPNLEARTVELLQKTAADLEKLAAPYQQSRTITTQVRCGTPVLAAIHETLRNKHDLIIKPMNPGVGIFERFLSGIDLQLLRKSPCPVWLLPPQTPQKYDRIVAALDFDPWHPDPETDALNRRILELTSALAMSDFADLHLVHCWEPLSQEMMRLWGDDEDREKIADSVHTEHLQHQEGLERLSNQLRGWIGAEAYDFLKPIPQHLLKGSVPDTIPALVKELDLDLVVMGTIGRSGIPGLVIGNTAESLLSRLPCALLAIEPEGFLSPVRLSE